MRKISHLFVPKGAFTMLSQYNALFAKNILAAIEKDSLPEFKKLLQKHNVIDLNRPVDPRFQVTLLTLSIEHGTKQLSIAKYLLANPSINVNTITHDGSTPLHYAVQFVKPIIAELLLKKGANINAIKHNGCMPFDLIFYAEVSDEKTREALCKTLIEYKANPLNKHFPGEDDNKPTFDCFESAITDNKPKTFETLLKFAPSAALQYQNVVHPPNWGIYEEKSAFHRLICKKDDFDPIVTNLLHFSIIEKKKQMVKILLMSKIIDPLAKIRTGANAIDMLEMLYPDLTNLAKATISEIKNKKLLALINDEKSSDKAATIAYFSPTIKLSLSSKELFVLSTKKLENQ